jgi:mannonate dehydratase
METEHPPTDHGSTDYPMVPAIRFNRPTAERLRYSKQLGVESVIAHPYKLAYLPDDELPLSTEPPWSFEELVHLRTRIEDAGLELGAIENLPMNFYDDVMLGRDGRDGQLAAIKETIRNIGSAGIPILGYHWMPVGVWRTSLSRPGRGGAEATAYDHAELRDAPLAFDREYSEAECWDNYEYFLREVLPVAEEAGVTLCLHPDDPPVASLQGVPRLFRNVENVERAMELVPSDNHGVEFCLGTFSEMDLDTDLTGVIERFGGRDEIVYVHFRDVDGTVPAFQEVFIDEGNYDEWAIVNALHDVGFDGMVIPDHVPTVEGEPKWRPRGRAYTVGYIEGMLTALGAAR